MLDEWAEELLPVDYILLEWEYLVDKLGDVLLTDVVASVRR